MDETSLGGVPLYAVTHTLAVNSSMRSATRCVAKTATPPCMRRLAESKVPPPSTLCSLTGRTRSRRPASSNSFTGRMPLLSSKSLLLLQAANAVPPPPGCPKARDGFARSPGPQANRNGTQPDTGQESQDVT